MESELGISYVRPHQCFEVAYVVCCGCLPSFSMMSVRVTAQTDAWQLELLHGNAHQSSLQVSNHKVVFSHWQWDVQELVLLFVQVRVKSSFAGSHLQQGMHTSRLPHSCQPAARGGEGLPRGSRQVSLHTGCHWLPLSIPALLCCTLTHTPAPQPQAPQAVRCCWPSCISRQPFSAAP